MARKPVVRDPAGDAEWSDQDAYAMRAFAEGKANEAQQKQALAWIVRACGHRPFHSYFNADPQTHYFVQGRLDVARQIQRLISVNVASIVKARNAFPKMLASTDVMELLELNTEFRSSTQKGARK